MTPDRLLAKSRQKHSLGTPPEITLVGHTCCVLRAADALFGGKQEPTRLGRSWLRFFGLVPGDFDRFRRHLRVSAAGHDWGKANDGFQDAVTEQGEQVVRHEHLSGLLFAEALSDEKARAWLAEADIDEAALLAAVISHHVKVAPGSPYSGDEFALGALRGKRESLSLLSSHDDFNEIWRMVQAEVGSPCPATIEFPPWWNKKTIGEKSGALKKLLKRVHSELRDDAHRRRWVAAVRSGLIVADAVGSAVVRFDRSSEGTAEEAIARWVGERMIESDFRSALKPAEEAIARWVDECFSTTLTGREIWEKVTEKRIDELRAKKRWDDRSGQEFAGVRGFSGFQCTVAEKGPRVLLTAACGSGKTLAAWNWIKTQVDARPDCPVSRVLFLYPTRATATEGFRDYVSWAPEDDAGLLSGTADYELEGMFETPEGENDRRKGRDYRADPRLYSLGHWKKRIFSATADQFFPFMQYGYGPLCLLPLLAEAVVVVDEVHSFDKSMFNTLRRFLNEFTDVPVLCMTATLTDERRSELVKCGLVPCSDQETAPSSVVKDSSYLRYRVRWVDREEAKWLAGGALNDRKRVLWVSNRVADCQEVFNAFDVDDGCNIPGENIVHCYHSRFKLEDRRDRHQALVRAFQDAVKDGAKARPVLGATTQVCELSLDLDAEVLVTELAPVSSLIQRMGRCNRDSKRMREKDHSIGRVYVMTPRPGMEKPYEKEDLDIAREFVDKIHGQDVSQDLLEQLSIKFDPGEHEPKKLCPFLDSGPYAEGKVEPFRDIDEFTVPCVLDRDLPAVLSILRGRDPSRSKTIDGFIVPVPRWLANEPRPESSDFPGWLSVAPQYLYHKRVGFKESKRQSPGGRDT